MHLLRASYPIAQRDRCWSSSTRSYHDCGGRVRYDAPVRPPQVRIARVKAREEEELCQHEASLNETTSASVAHMQVEGVRGDGRVVQACPGGSIVWSPCSARLLVRSASLVKRRY